MHPIRCAVAVFAALTLVVTSTGTAAATPDPHHDAVRKALTAVVDSGVTGAQIRVTRDGRGFTARAGVAKAGSQREVPVNGRFRVGSITKTFASVVTLQLAAEGKLALDAPVDGYLPGLLPQGKQITVRNLLQHTSGLHNYTESLPKEARELLARRWERHTALEFVQSSAAKPPLFPVGTKFSYSNTNYLVVQLIIEKVTGQPWAAAANQRILRPLGLRDTEVPGTFPFIRGPHARGYIPLDGKPADITAFNPTWAGAAGEIISTTADLDTFLRALLAGKLLEPAQQAELTRTTAVSPNYGLGITSASMSCGVTVWGHNGGVPGYLSVMVGSQDGSRRVEASVTTGLGLDERAMLKAVDTAVCG